MAGEGAEAVHPAVVVAQRLSEELRGMKEEMRESNKKSAKRLRRTLVVLIFDIMLTIGLLYNTHRSDHAVHLATVAVAKAAVATSASQINANNAVAACQAGNQSSARNLKLWNNILGLPQLAPLTPVLRPLVTDAFVQRDCTVPVDTTVPGQS